MPKKRKPLVGIAMGSDSDYKILEGLFNRLDFFGIPWEAKVLSAHRTAERAAEYAKSAEKRGLKLLIAAAGHAAHLAGNMAAYTTLPVIGVPIDSSCLQGLDALLSTVQMPPGVPVGTMAIGKSGAENAAIYTAQILALSNKKLAAKLKKFKADMAEGVLQEKQNKLNELLKNRKKTKEKTS